MPTVPYKNKEGKRLKGATTIIGGNLGWNKNTLMAWQAREFKAGNDPTDKSKKACDIGTLCHHYISCDFLKQTIDAEFKAQYDVDAITIADRCLAETKKKLIEHGLELTHSELSLISEEYQYGGTIDVVMKEGSIIVLGDIKTSNASKSCPTGIYADHIIQLGAYDNLLIENKIATPEKYMFIHINKSPTIEDSDMVHIITVPNATIKRGFEVFKMLKQLDQINYNKELEI